MLEEERNQRIHLLLVMPFSLFDTATLVDDFHADEASVASGLVCKSVGSADFLRGVFGVEFRAVCRYASLCFAEFATTTIGVLTTGWCAFALRLNADMLDLSCACVVVGVAVGATDGLVDFWATRGFTTALVVAEFADGTLGVKEARGAAFAFVIDADMGAAGLAGAVVGVAVFTADLAGLRAVIGIWCVGVDFVGVVVFVVIVTVIPPTFLVTIVSIVSIVVAIGIIHDDQTGCVHGQANEQNEHQ